MVTLRGGPYPVTYPRKSRKDPFLKGVAGDAINLFMPAAAFNCRKWMRKQTHLFAFILSWLFDETKKDLATQTVA